MGFTGNNGVKPSGKNYSFKRGKRAQVLRIPSTEKSPKVCTGIFVAPQEKTYIWCLGGGRKQKRGKMFDLVTNSFPDKHSVLIGLDDVIEFFQQWKETQDHSMFLQQDILVTAKTWFENVCSEVVRYKESGELGSFLRKVYFHMACNGYPDFLHRNELSENIVKIGRGLLHHAARDFLPIRVRPRVVSFLMFWVLVYTCEQPNVQHVANDIFHPPLDNSGYVMRWTMEYNHHPFETFLHQKYDISLGTDSSAEDWSGIWKEMAPLSRFLPTSDELAGFFSKLRLDGDTVDTSE